MTNDKIISLVPSITLTLFDLGLEQNIIGRTKFCIHPREKVNAVPTIGGTKNPDIQKIRSLKPDLIFAAKEENEKEQIQELKKDFKVIVFDIKNLDDNYAMIEKIGKLTGTIEKAAAINKKIKLNFTDLQSRISKLAQQHTDTLYLIWRKPYLTVGKDTFIHDMMERIGLKNLFGHQTRYPVIHNFQTRYFDKCKIVLLSSEPYPFTEKHISEIQQLLPKAKILLADGEYFSWYGSKMIGAPAYFQQLMSDIIT